MMEPIILFVDDEPAILRAIKRIFRRSGLQVLTATTSAEALRTLEQLPISVLVSDYSMPDRSGAELLEQAITIRPETVRIILSGNNDQTAAIAAINQGKIFKFLTKPFDEETLLSEINAAISEWKSRIFAHSEKKLLKQAPFLEFISTELSQNKDAGTIAVVFAIRELELLTEQLGANKAIEFLISIAPSHERLANGVSLALLDKGYFCALLKPGETNTNPVESISSLLAVFDVKPHFEGREYRIKFDVGYAVAQNNIVDGSRLVSNAKMAMKSARENKASCFVAFDKEWAATRSRMVTLENSLHTALANNELALVYQPKIDISKQLLHGAEALIRWNSQTLGQVSPLEFIPLAERSGMINDIGHWVIQEASRQWRSWFPDADTGPVISVNVSSVQLKNTDFIQGLEHALAKHNIPPSLLELELTESLMVENINQVIDRLQTIRDLGVKLSIDDFGTGYSSLNYLSRLPIDTIKIDRSFVIGMLESDEMLTMIRNMIRLGHDMGMELVAEGVEDANQLRVLKELGCNVSQGYYFSPPVPPDAFIEKTSNILNFHSSPSTLRSAGSS